MKKELNVVGLDCANCALTLEKYLQTVKGVNSCVLNFSTSKIYLDIEEDDYKVVLKNIYKLAKQVNPDVKLSEETGEQGKTNYLELILYLIGLTVGIVVLFVPMNIYLYYSLLIISGLCMGYKTYLKAILQLRHLKINENTLVTLSIIGAIAVCESMEGLMVIALYTLGKILEAKAVNYSRKSISKLIDNQPEYATIIDGENERQVTPEEVKIGDIIIVKAGEKIALDGIIIEGNANVDKKHLTGESLPIQVEPNIEIEAGSIVLDSTLKIKVLREYKDSTVYKILNLVTDATNKKSKTESFISKFASFYTLGVIIASVFTCIITMLILKDWSVAIYRGLIFLVVSCPCAFAISVPLSYFSGIGKCSSLGVLVKGSNYLDTCANLKHIVFDKTGTLTTGKFTLKNIEILDENYTEKQVLEIVVAGEQNSLHPVAVAICEYYGKKSKLKIEKFKEISGYGIEYCVENSKYKVGRTKTDTANTVVELVKNNKIIAKMYLQDEIKDNVKNVIKDLKVLGISTTMLTGDNGVIAKSVAEEIGVDKFKAGLYPKDKFEILEDIKKSGSTAFVGDGLNDAPALAISDVGISMGLMGSDATIEASDVVIADDKISKITSLINVSKYTKKIVLQNIIFAGVTKLIFLVLGAVGITGMFFAVLADVGVTLLAILNSLRVLKIK